MFSNHSRELHHRLPSDDPNEFDSEYNPRVDPAHLIESPKHRLENEIQKFPRNTVVGPNKEIFPLFDSKFRSFTNKGIEKVPLFHKKI